MDGQSATPEFTTRKLYPRRARDLPEWDVIVGGRVVGWVRELRIGSSRVVFFEGVGVLPDGRPVSLENSTDVEERFRVVVEFSVDPEKYARHWRPWGPSR